MCYEGCADNREAGRLVSYLLVCAGQVNVRVRHAIGGSHVPRAAAALQLLLDGLQLLLLLLQVLHGLLRLLGGAQFHILQLSRARGDLAQRGLQVLDIRAVVPLRILTSGV